MKLFNYYSDKIDKAWYKSSNIVYSECEDIENDFKKLKIVFSTGAQYIYEDVDVRDYLTFREADSQGKALNSWLKEKKLKYTKLDNANLGDIEEEYIFYSGNGIIINNEKNFTLLDTNNTILTQREEKLNEAELDLVKNILESIGKKIKVKE